MQVILENGKLFYKKGEKINMRKTEVMLKLTSILCSEQMITTEEMLKLNQKIKSGYEQ